ncbi:MULTISPECIES: Lrp/AsnC family transcriptional regulator [unclassified Paracoccus (in: a-proteobacteria)]|uniref:Lrp/AsnC family transcriptional regulator n=1 Tax=unclassified Paracoccus (in: a-proteobacteria) TaxID=2688777 RepID=UPI0012B1F7A8|nr:MULTISPECIES: Lrp/AsnC family transcriptional regulator [unclassified Paracoccus (in: a-proteobacteria)]UXU76490.1 Lrp/AsnC family transcriptional regulator [Paracoccus sp. SMMA_5]UXU82172.1 Lrp/AsnC family transcriptional regulator [Paracoccus sp. SMMA_5_TC]
MIELDAIDQRILACLEAEGRMPILELAERVGLSPTPCGRRVKRLEESGVITGYGARVDARALGLNVSVLIAVRLARGGPDANAVFLRGLRGRPEVVECFLVTGNNIDYMLRVQVRDIDALGRFIRDVLQAIPAVAETSTMVILKQGLD